ncbi:hypothetical protein [Nonomuraea sp. NPDC003709]|uniref:hypothetical protein n=1 Tax=Nonomuraea sp. NPDC003709 TaxID=3154450 RepID=UPI00339FE11F
MILKVGSLLGKPFSAGPSAQPLVCNVLTCTLFPCLIIPKPERSAGGLVLVPIIGRLASGDPRSDVFCSEPVASGLGSLERCSVLRRCSLRVDAAGKEVGHGIDVQWFTGAAGFFGAVRDVSGRPLAVVKVLLSG